MKGNAILAEKQPVWWAGFVPQILDSLRSQGAEELECLGVKPDPKTLALGCYSSHELWNSWLYVCPVWNWAKSLQTLEDLGVWTSAAGNPRTFWVTDPCESPQWLFVEVRAWKHLSFQEPGSGGDKSCLESRFPLQLCIWTPFMKCS